MRISDWSSYVCSSDLRIISSNSVATTSAETGPSTMPAISFTTSRKLRPDLWIRLGLVVTPSSRPVCASSAISFTSAVSRSEEHTSELQSLMRISYAVFCLKKNSHTITQTHDHTRTRSPYSPHILQYNIKLC